MISFGKSDIGKAREANEDSIFFSDEKVGHLPNLYIVSDGMGGHKAGEIASSLAVNSFVSFIRKEKLDTDNEILDLLVNALDYANKIVYEKSVVDNACEGMGATFSACTVFDNKLYAVHVGDSRIYLANKTGINLLSLDHTYVNEMVRVGKITSEQAKHHPQKNIITRAVGINPKIEADAFVETLNFDDYVLICSDGLTCMLDDKQIFDTITQTDFDLNQKVLNCIQNANDNGGYDNISVILISGVSK